MVPKQKDQGTHFLCCLRNHPYRKFLAGGDSTRPDTYAARRHKVLLIHFHRRQCFFYSRRTKDISRGLSQFGIPRSHTVAKWSPVYIRKITLPQQESWPKIYFRPPCCPLCKKTPSSNPDQASGSQLVMGRFRHNKQLGKL